jgi:hypothetical protein
VNGWLRKTDWDYLEMMQSRLYKVKPTLAASEAIGFELFFIRA